jgi:hypothetical protein
MARRCRGEEKRVVQLNCPHCDSPRVHPEPCRWYERLLALLLLHPFRCRRCGTRFLRFAGITRPPGMLASK